jgi:uncharacterized protein YecT (DUF1311 family)
MRAFASALLLAIGANSSSPASAQTAAPKIDCGNANTTVELNYCEEQELEKADKALNEVYRTTLARIDKTTGLEPKVRAAWRKAVQDAQRKWIAFRDADCKGATAFEWYGGTGATVAVLGCTRAMTVERTKELRERNER